MSIASEISRLNTAKADIKAVLEGKGISVSSTLKIDGYAELIDLGLVPDTRVAVKYNVTDTSSPTQLCYNDAVSQFSEIEIDGVVQPLVVDTYTFSTTGEHTVKYTLTDPTSIGQQAFRQCSGLTSINIPNSVTSIGSYAFRQCSGLTSIEIPDSVTSIGGSAFDNTPWWNSYSADTSHHYGNVIYINDVAYKATATTITSAELKDSTVGIGGYAFNGCTSLTSIVIPDSVTSISSSAFQGCSGLTSVTIPDSVTIIDKNAFDGCRSLPSIAIPNSVTSIGLMAFRGCRSLPSIAIPNSVTSIENYAFDHCSGFTSCTIGSGVTSIGEYAFNGCSSLTSATVNATTPPTLGEDAFERNASGRKIYVPSASVNAYKTATNWSTYASDIEPIP